MRLPKGSIIAGCALVIAAAAPIGAWPDVPPWPPSGTDGGLAPETEAQLLAMGASVVMEAIAALGLFALLRWGSAWRAAAAAVVGTLATHWLLWTGVNAAAEAVGWLPAVTVGEALVVLAEAVAYRFVGGFGWRRALILSLSVNLASFVAGLSLMIVAR